MSTAFKDSDSSIARLFAKSAKDVRSWMESHPGHESYQDSVSEKPRDEGSSKPDSTSAIPEETELNEEGDDGNSEDDVANLAGGKAPEREDSEESSYAPSNDNNYKDPSVIYREKNVSQSFAEILRAAKAGVKSTAKKAVDAVEKSVTKSAPELEEESRKLYATRTSVKGKPVDAHLRAHAAKKGAKKAKMGGRVRGAIEAESDAEDDAEGEHEEVTNSAALAEAVAQAEAQADAIMQARAATAATAAADSVAIPVAADDAEDTDLEEGSDEGEAEDNGEGEVWDDGSSQGGDSEEDDSGNNARDDGDGDDDDDDDGDSSHDRHRQSHRKRRRHDRRESRHHKRRDNNHEDIRHRHHGRRRHHTRHHNRHHTRHETSHHHSQHHVSDHYGHEHKHEHTRRLEADGDVEMDEGSRQSHGRKELLHHEHHRHGRHGHDVHYRGHHREHHAGERHSHHERHRNGGAHEHDSKEVSHHVHRSQEGKEHHSTRKGDMKQKSPHEGAVGSHHAPKHDEVEDKRPMKEYERGREEHNDRPKASHVHAKVPLSSMQETVKQPDEDASLSGVEVRHFGSHCDKKLIRSFKFRRIPPHATGMLPTQVPAIHKVVAGRFSRNQGFFLRNTFADKGEYTIALLAKLNSIKTAVKIVDFNNRRNDEGLYIKQGGHVEFRGAIGVKYGDVVRPVRPGKFFQLVLLRELSGQVRVYVNGRLQLSFDDSKSRVAVTATESLGNGVKGAGLFVLFLDDHHRESIETSSGWNAMIRVFSGALSERQLQHLDLAKYSSLPELPMMPGNSRDPGASVGYGVDQICGWQMAFFGGNSSTDPNLYYSYKLGSVFAPITMGTLGHPDGQLLPKSFDGPAYTLAFVVVLDNTDGTRRLLSFGKSKAALYASNGSLSFMTKDGHVVQQPSNVVSIKDKIVTSIVLTRKENGEVTVYANGHQSLQFSDAGAALPHNAGSYGHHAGYDGFSLFPREEDGIAADGTEPARGWLSRVRLLPRALFPVDVEMMNLLVQPDPDVS